MKTPRSAHPTQTNGLQVPSGSDDAAAGRRMTRRAAVLALGSSAVVALGGMRTAPGEGLTGIPADRLARRDRS